MSNEKVVPIIADKLVQWAQNEEMIDQWYTQHGYDCMEAAALLNEQREEINLLRTMLKMEKEDA